MTPAMVDHRGPGGALFAFGLLMPDAASAHGFGAAYNLPVPLDLYNLGAVSTLVLSFVLVGLLWSRASPRSPDAGLDISSGSLARALRFLLPMLQVMSVLVLALCIVAGFIGTPDPLRNFAPVFFWIIFLLVFTYLVALVGDVYAALNPFRVLSEFLARIWHGSTRGIFRYPQWLADWPALILYMGFIWLELFSHRTPKTLASFLLAYTALNILGVVLVGSRNWFRHCEFFSVFFRLVALLAPVDYRRDDSGGRHLRLRLPLSGLLHQRPQHLSTVTFVLAMISTTAMDGLQMTQWWVGLFWNDPTGLLADWLGGSPKRMMTTLMPVYLVWESFWLAVSPFVYLGAYLFALALAKLITRSSRPLRLLAMDFSYSLLPIALVYNVTHYWTLITSHGQKILSLVSDPFGWRWDLFGTAMKFRAPVLPEMGMVWHSQVGLILFGHVLSVWIAHRIALGIWPSRSQAMLSQIPVLLLMVGFTVLGLWILAEPLTAVRLR